MDKVRAGFKRSAEDKSDAEDNATSAVASDLVEAEIWRIWRPFYHDLMQAPATLRLSLEVIAKYLPKLVACYRKEHTDSVDSSATGEIDQSTLDFLNNAAVSVNALLEAHLWIIRLKRMQLAPINPVSFPLTRCDMTECIDRAFAEFPARILHNFIEPLSVPKIKNFVFQGNAEIMKHILFNLLDLSFWGMRDAGKETPEELQLVVTEDQSYNYLHIKNFGNKIPAKDLAKLFTKFYSTKMSRDGTSFGLYFCRKAMHYFGGDICYNAEAPEGYVEFILQFKK